MNQNYSCSHKLLRFLKPSPYKGPDLIEKGGGLVVTVLTGGRPEYLNRTLGRAKLIWRVFPEAQVIAYVNQSDARSTDILKLHSIPYTSSPTGRLTSIGYGVSILANAALNKKGARWWMHLEDDWLMDVRPDRVRLALQEATHVLADREDVKQIRLRSCYEEVLPYHMVDKNPLVWDLSSGRYAVSRAHWTFNPSLVRVDPDDPVSVLAQNIEGEIDAQRRIHRRFPSLRAVQLCPGIFSHGGEDSLRIRGGHPW